MKPLKDGDSDLDLEEAKVPPPPSTPEPIDQQKQLMAFVSLVVIQGSNILFFKLSGTGGKYRYNTASAIAITEFVKLLMSITFMYREKAAGKSGSLSIPQSLVFGYFVLAVIYCVNNQLTFWLLSTLGAGQLQMGKSVAPMLTAGLLWVFYDEQMNKAQWACLIIFVCGLIGVMGGGSPISTFFSSLGNPTVAMLMIACNLTAFSSVYNSKMLQQDKSLSVHAQNATLYFFGFILSLFAYTVGFTPSDPDLSFFGGMDNFNVIMVLFSQAFIGLAISFVYKYGGAIVKTLAAGVQAAILSVIDTVFFGLPSTFGSVAGTVTVLATSYLYFSVALKLPNDDQKGTSSIPTKLRVYAYLFLLGSYLGYVGLARMTTSEGFETVSGTRRRLLEFPAANFDPLL
eukprot:CAMPEP_0175089234 /NCGR_PEP_ID=MMETSP0086_2-20121207/680_1 /TAXON_ID=136419 /ORGANISM="Unknown Unknown, Strain D1" /LENGTH=399 /DNA_ID=CAMNT_0016361735 /DNA_START=46 /DNA_END=1245 /DNA_ORIENTATION=+